MNGRIETYIHSDAVTQNKGGAMVAISCETDFAAKTDEFVAFCKKVAMLAYAAENHTDEVFTWFTIIKAYPELEDDRLALCTLLKENIELVDVVTMAF